MDAGSTPRHLNQVIPSRSHPATGRLRCLTSPTIARGAQVARFPEPGSRDALCTLIGSEVRAISGAVGGELRVEVRDEAMVSTPLSYDAAAGPEVLHFRNEAAGLG